MASTLLIGANSTIAKALQKNSDREFLTFSRSDGTLNLEGELSELDAISNINGLVYFPGTINLKPFTMLKEDDFLNDFKVNVLGAAKVVKKVINKLKEADGASVVLISSVAANVGLPFHASIGASKSALEGMARSLAAEYTNARVCFNVVAPSLTQTNLSTNLLKTERLIEASKERNPMKEIGDPNKIAKTIDFLLDAHNNWMTGQVVSVDGGMNNLK
ncbi:MAG: SDR family oxidoreductase [Gammaproteobacteria bacterium TMED112]|nr:MAG: SDR family oxidoreductase [Gammaproteobacteria bacterium TMED112]|tara:strand:- start:25411 stop:26064 length:654 start_codon:yes stop_codon:yes gene_type:complete